ncbi:unnamed protein product [Paramecium sonneborni]|uniref:Uncharacterized protein n=1 Tax=Paramecium sonneborni TaxID=65129 RepID=A0A8S1QWM9_9CILI|nr:unnamed protein product [Paramecium sonneborni]
MYYLLSYVQLIILCNLTQRKSLLDQMNKERQYNLDIELLTLKALNLLKLAMLNEGYRLLILQR